MHAQLPPTLAINSSRKGKKGVDVGVVQKRKRSLQIESANLDREGAKPLLFLVKRAGHYFREKKEKKRD